MAKPEVRRIPLVGSAVMNVGVLLLIIADLAAVVYVFSTSSVVYGLLALFVATPVALGLGRFVLVILAMAVSRPFMGPYRKLMKADAKWDTGPLAIDQVGGGWAEIYPFGFDLWSLSSGCTKLTWADVANGAPTSDGTSVVLNLRGDQMIVLTPKTGEDLAVLAELVERRVASPPRGS